MKPDIMLDSIFAIDYLFLHKHHIKALILDLDNTIIAWNSTQVPAKLAQWVHGLARHGIQIMIVANNPPMRVQGVAGKLGIPYIAKASKPQARVFETARTRMSCNSEEVAVVGDRVFQDIATPFKLRMFTILVRPIKTNEFFLIKLIRVIESFYLRQWKKQGMDFQSTI